MKSLTYEEFANMLQIAPDTEVKEGCATLCPVKAVLDILQGKWKNYVLYELCSHETIRFNTLKKRLPDITNAALTNTLKELEQCGLVKREQFSEIPPRVEYSLTPRGRDLMPVFHRMYEWAVKHWDTEEFRKYKDYSGHSRQN